VAPYPVVSHHSLSDKKARTHEADETGDRCDPARRSELDAAGSNGDEGRGAEGERDDHGKEDTIWAPPEMARFNELKVGDRVNLTYAESLVFQLRKPGAASQKPSETAAVAATGTALPGAKAARQVTTTVTVKSVDPAVPSITVTTADGRTVTRKIADKANLQGVAPGDRIDITYTEAILANVERAK
jgi:Cu/Ag efflux protein CusF